MLYTSTQAAQFLGITKHAVRKLVAAGKLKDVAIVKPGVSRHATRIQLAELKTYKKENKLVTKTPAPRAARKSPEITVNFSGAGVLSRLDRIEAKLDSILKLWS